jgi:hypothetical protein
MDTLFIVGLLLGAVGMLTALLMVGSIEWETTYEVVRDDEGAREVRNK